MLSAIPGTFRTLAPGLDSNAPLMVKGYIPLERQTAIGAHSPHRVYGPHRVTRVQSHVEGELVEFFCGHSRR